MAQFQTRFPPKRTDEFLRGYLSAAEYSVDLEGASLLALVSLKGFRRMALAEMSKHCAVFCVSQERNLTEYLQHYTLFDAGYSYYVSRNGYAGGFISDTLAKPHMRLHQAARKLTPMTCRIGRVFLTYVTREIAERSRKVKPATNTFDKGFHWR